MNSGEPKNVVPWSCNRAFGAGGLTSGFVHNLDSAHAGLRKDGEGPVKITPPEKDIVINAAALAASVGALSEVGGRQRLLPARPPGPLLPENICAALQAALLLGKPFTEQQLQRALQRGPRR